jgi:hypothetical protein
MANVTSTVAKNFEQISYGSPSGAMITNRATGTLTTAAATTLTAQQAGLRVFWDAAAGFTLTLPKPVVGLDFEITVGTSVTSSNHKVITDALTTFMLGEVLMYTTATASPAGFAFDGATHVACTMNGTTTGGLVGTTLRFHCISATVWFVTGTILGSGTIATPAATS